MLETSTLWPPASRKPHAAAILGPWVTYNLAIYGAPIPPYYRPSRLAGTRTFGVDRGERLRARHLEEGRDVNLRTMQEHLDLPAVSLWEFRDGETEISESKMFKTCTFCPYMGVWQEFEDGPAIGYLYDFEFHLAQYQAYLPGTLVEFDGVKTRGDAVCRFRFQAPHGEEVHA